MSYKQAKGAIPWEEGDEPPEEMIRRIRGDTSKLEAQLTAAEEQLAEMHDASEELEGVIFAWLAAEDGYDEGLIESCAYRLRNARLSAVPKRGLALWEGEADVIEGQEDKELVIYIGASSTLEVNAFALWIYGRPKELKGGQSVTVTVWEKEAKDARTNAVD